MSRIAAPHPHFISYYNSDSHSAKMTYFSEIIKIHKAGKITQKIAKKIFSNQDIQLEERSYFPLDMCHKKFYLAMYPEEVRSAISCFMGGKNIKLDSMVPLFLNYLQNIPGYKDNPILQELHFDQLQEIQDNKVPIKDIKKGNLKDIFLRSKEIWKDRYDGQGKSLDLDKAQVDKRSSSFLNQTAFFVSFYHPKRDASHSELVVFSKQADAWRVIRAWGESSGLGGDCYARAFLIALFFIDIKPYINHLKEDSSLRDLYLQVLTKSALYKNSHFKDEFTIEKLQHDAKQLRKQLSLYFESQSTESFGNFLRKNDNKQKELYTTYHLLTDFIRAGLIIAHKEDFSIYQGGVPVLAGFNEHFSHHFNKVLSKINQLLFPHDLADLQNKKIRRAMSQQKIWRAFVRFYPKNKNNIDISHAQKIFNQNLAMKTWDIEEGVIAREFISKVRSSQVIATKSFSKVANMFMRKTFESFICLIHKDEPLPLYNYDEHYDHTSRAKIYSQIVARDWHLTLKHTLDGAQCAMSTVLAWLLLGKEDININRKNPLQHANLSMQQSPTLAQTKTSFLETLSFLLQKALTEKSNLFLEDYLDEHGKAYAITSQDFKNLVRDMLKDLASGDILKDIDLFHSQEINHRYKYSQALEESLERCRKTPSSASEHFKSIDDYKKEIEKHCDFQDLFHKKQQRLFNDSSNFFSAFVGNPNALAKYIGGMQSKFERYTQSLLTNKEFRHFVAKRGGNFIKLSLVMQKIPDFIEHFTYLSCFDTVASKELKPILLDLLLFLQKNFGFSYNPSQKSFIK